MGVKMEFRETCSGQLIEAKDNKGREWEVVIIQAGRSGNAAYYPPEVLQVAVSLFEGVRALARTDEEHLRDTKRSVKDIVGWFSQPRFESNRIISRFHISESADWLRRLLLDAWQQGKKDIVVFSIVAEPKALQAENERLRGELEKRDRIIEMMAEYIGRMALNEEYYYCPYGCPGRNQKKHCARNDHTKDAKYCIENIISRFTREAEGKI